MEQQRFWSEHLLNVTGEDFADQIDSQRLRVVGRLELYGCLTGPQVGQLLEVREQLAVREVVVNTTVESVILLGKVAELMARVETAVVERALPSRLSRLQFTVIFQAIINCHQLKLRFLGLINVPKREDQMSWDGYSYRDPT